MTSAYTPSLRLELPVQGELTSSWGDRVNLGITSLVDTAIAGTANVVMTDANYTLVSANGTTDEARAMFITVTGTLTATRNVIVPTASKMFYFTNSTTGGQAVVVKTAAGTGVTVNSTERVCLYCNGTNVVVAMLNANFTTATVSGTLFVGGALTAANNLSVGGNTVLSGTVTDGTREFGYRGLPAASVTSGTFIATDRGKCVYAVGSVGVPDATMAAGDVVTIINVTASAISITPFVSSLRLAGTTATGIRTLAGYGIATIVFGSSTAAYITGTGLS